MPWYLTSVAIHIIAAAIWVGGMAFVALVIVPYTRRSCGDNEARTLLAVSGHRFRAVVWACFSLLILTGIYNLYVRGVSLSALVDPEFLSTPYGRTLALKLLAVFAAISLAAIHDFVVGPRALTEPPDDAARRARTAARWIGRATALLAIVIVGSAVAFVRGR